MHEANGAGYRQGARLLVWASQPTPAPQCGVVDSSSCGAADGATRITPDAVCIPKRSQPREGEGRRALEGYPRPARARAIGSTPATDADHSRRRHPHGHSGARPLLGLPARSEKEETRSNPSNPPRMAPWSRSPKPSNHVHVMRACYQQCSGSQPAGGGRPSDGSNKAAGTRSFRSHGDLYHLKLGGPNSVCHETSRWPGGLPTPILGALKRTSPEP